MMYSVELPKEIFSPPSYNSLFFNMSDKFDSFVFIQSIALGKLLLEFLLQALMFSALRGLFSGMCEIIIAGGFLVSKSTFSSANTILFDTYISNEGAPKNMHEATNNVKKRENLNNIITFIFTTKFCVELLLLHFI